MMRAAAWLLLLLVTAAGSAAAQSPASDPLTEARQLNAAGKRPDAIALLRRQVDQSPRDDDARLLLGIMLSWDGKYEEARPLLKRVIAARPSYLDAYKALANVELWSDHPREAKDLLDKALEMAPNDSAVIVARRRAVDGIAELRPWEVTATENRDWFNEGREAWQEHQVSISNQTPAGALIARASQARRFGLRDNQYEAEMYPHLWKGAYGYVSFGWAPDRKLYPRYRYAGDVYQSIGAGFEVAVGFRRLRFDGSGNTDIYVGALSKYIGNWLATGRVYYIPDRHGSNNAYTYQGTLRRYFGADGTSYVGARYSRGLAREELRSVDDFEVLTSDTAGAELRVDLGRFRLGASGGASRQDRLGQKDLLHYSASATIGVRF